MEEKDREFKIILVCKEEIKVLTAIKDQLLNKNSSLMEEIKQLKQTLMIPRNHFKYLSNVKTLDEIIAQKEEANRKLKLKPSQTNTLASRLTDHESAHQV